MEKKEIDVSYIERAVKADKEKADKEKIMSKKKEDLGEELSEIKLNDFVKGDTEPTEPICKNCQTPKECEYCQYKRWIDLGKPLDSLFGSFAEAIATSMVGAFRAELRFDSLTGHTGGFEKFANKIILNAIRELKMQIKAEE